MALPRVREGKKGCVLSPSEAESRNDDQNVLTSLLFFFSGTGAAFHNNLFFVKCSLLKIKPFVPLLPLCLTLQAKIMFQHFFT